MILSKGFMYRLGQRIKDFGELIACYPVIWLGRAIKDAVLNQTIEGL